MIRVCRPSNRRRHVRHSLSSSDTESTQDSMDIISDCPLCCSEGKSKAQQLHGDTTCHRHKGVARGGGGNNEGDRHQQRRNRRTKPPSRETRYALPPKRVTRGHIGGDGNTDRNRKGNVGGNSHHTKSNSPSIHRNTNGNGNADRCERNEGSVASRKSPPSKSVSHRKIYLESHQEFSLEAGGESHGREIIREIISQQRSTPPAPPGGRTNASPLTPENNKQHQRVRGRSRGFHRSTATNTENDMSAQSNERQRTRRQSRSFHGPTAANTSNDTPSQNDERQRVRGRSRSFHGSTAASTAIATTSQNDEHQRVEGRSRSFHGSTAANTANDTSVQNKECQRIRGRSHGRSERDPKKSNSDSNLSNGSRRESLGNNIESCIRNNELFEQQSRSVSISARKRTSQGSIGSSMANGTQTTATTTGKSALSGSERRIIRSRSRSRCRSRSSRVSRTAGGEAGNGDTTSTAAITTRHVTRYTKKQNPTTAIGAATVRYSKVSMESVREAQEKQKQERQSMKLKKKLLSDECSSKPTKEIWGRSLSRSRGRSRSASRGRSLCSKSRGRDSSASNTTRHTQSTRAPTKEIFTPSHRLPSHNSTPSQLNQTNGNNDDSNVLVLHRTVRSRDSTDKHQSSSRIRSSSLRRQQSFKSVDVEKPRKQSSLQRRRQGHSSPDRKRESTSSKLLQYYLEATSGAAIDNAASTATNASALNSGVVDNDSLVVIPRRCHRSFNEDISEPNESGLVVIPRRTFKSVNEDISEAAAGKATTTTNNNLTQIRMGSGSRHQQRKIRQYYQL